MRELNNVEIESVSGAWLFADIGAAIGYGVGALINKGASKGGVTIDTTTASSQIGSGIGKIVELNLSGAVSDIGKGIVGLASALTGAKNQISA
ncbi:hypothetical protein LU631_04660 [Erwinia tracheiphila]|uniref:Uncharacterized protein n=1 Tax=Erwinia tracheiphila TaxID=65700 RepID=A0A345CXQ0_9GAMM|nr:hypothetical protein [Erwinia tracheiphila]AXF78217.1 hypothetical protein AV903_22905 [Erwinia tracheiphila]EOS95547.1 hypothetical protein ETR_07701 [Erwinia tracheiphila PSU-1]UIA83062.1 hypothetical protein LU604_22235 [Erwinia tracheiphila]UIA88671.1 hypothetical protein LU631_04660 [Erwinia tracheiphila]UIA91640.1 hypothetical protein LU632_21695 [Erwinia tracheiphila]